MADVPKLLWETAEVRDGELTVGLGVPVAKGWRNAFEHTVRQLNAGDWEISVHPKKGTVSLSAVQPGDEARVRQLIEGAVLQANATLVDEDELFGRSPSDPDSDSDSGGGSDSDDGSAEPSPDETLTETFRGFAQE